MGKTPEQLLEEVRGSDDPALVTWLEQEPNPLAAIREKMDYGINSIEDLRYLIWESRDKAMDILATERASDQTLVREWLDYTNRNKGKALDIITHMVNEKGIKDVAEWEKALEKALEKADEILVAAENSNDPSIILWLREMNKRDEKEVRMVLAARILEYDIEGLDDLKRVLNQVSDENARRIYDSVVDTTVYTTRHSSAA